jgi:hypothetical protein
LNVIGNNEISLHIHGQKKKYPNKPNKWTKQSTLRSKGYIKFQYEHRYSRKSNITPMTFCSIQAY